MGIMDQIDGPSLVKPAAWEKTRVEGAKVLQRLLELPIRVVGVGTIASMDDVATAQEAKLLAAARLDLQGGQ